MGLWAISDYRFQFNHLGKTHFASISSEALEDVFKGAGQPQESVYNANSAEIHRKAREILDRNVVRSPFRLTTLDFKD